MAGVRLAASSGWTVSVRSGGHSWAAWSLHDDALLIDLGALAPLSLRRGDRHRHRRARPRGARSSWSRSSPRAAARSPVGTARRSASAASCCRAARAGTAGPQGWACESVVAVDVVTADGELVRADAEHEHRPLLGRARRRARLPGHRHPLPPADLRAAGRDVARHLVVPPRRRRAGRALAARGAARPRPPGRAGARGDPAARRAAARRGRAPRRHRAAAAHHRAWPTPTRRRSGCSAAWRTARLPGASWAT